MGNPCLMSTHLVIIHSYNSTKQEVLKRGTHSCGCCIVPTATCSQLGPTLHYSFLQLCDHYLVPSLLPSDKKINGEASRGRKLWPHDSGKLQLLRIHLTMATVVSEHVHVMSHFMTVSLRDRVLTFNYRLSVIWGIDHREWEQAREGRSNSKCIGKDLLYRL